MSRGKNIHTINTTTKDSTAYGQTEIASRGKIFYGSTGIGLDVNPSEVRFSVDYAESILVMVDELPHGTTLVACTFNAEPDFAQDINCDSGLISECGPFKLIGEDTTWTPIDLGGRWEIKRDEDGKYDKGMMLVPLLVDTGFAVYFTDTGELLQAGDLRNVCVRFQKTKSTIVVPSNVWPGGAK